MKNNKKIEKTSKQSQYPDPQFKEYLNQLSSPNYQGDSWIVFFWFERNSSDWLWFKDGYPNNLG